MKRLMCVGLLLSFGCGERTPATGRKDAVGETPAVKAATPNPWKPLFDGPDKDGRYPVYSDSGWVEGWIREADKPKYPNLKFLRRIRDGHLFGFVDVNGEYSNDLFEYQRGD